MESIFLFVTYAVIAVGIGQNGRQKSFPESLSSVGAH